MAFLMHEILYKYVWYDISPPPQLADLLPHAEPAHAVVGRGWERKIEKSSDWDFQPIGQRKLAHTFSFPPECDLLLLEVPPLLLIHQHQIQVISEICSELLHSRCNDDTWQRTSCWYPAWLASSRTQQGKPCWTRESFHQKILGWLIIATWWGCSPL